MGLFNVTSRDLAKALQMSHGNLEYHFPTKESLVLAIYQQMKREISGSYVGQENDTSQPLHHFQKLLLRLDDFQRDYSFFCNDVMEICRTYKKVNQDLNRNMRIRKAQMSRFFERFITKGYMRSEPSEGYYERLQHTIRIILTFWQPQEIVIRNFDFKGKGEMVRHVWELILPHFTQLGVLTYHKVISGEN